MLKFQIPSLNALLSVISHFMSKLSRYFFFYFYPYIYLQTAAETHNIVFTIKIMSLHKFSDKK